MDFITIARNKSRRVCKAGNIPDVRRSEVCQLLDGTADTKNKVDFMIMIIISVCEHVHRAQGSITKKRPSRKAWNANLIITIHNKHVEGVMCRCVQQTANGVWRISVWTSCHVLQH
jgi:hypothetical protein